MKKEVMVISGVKTPELAFNHVVRAGDLLFLASQLSADLKTGKIIGGDIVEQTKQTLENIALLLKSCGSSLDDILKTVVYMRNISDFDKMDMVYKGYFKKGSEPARVTIQSASPINGIDIEIEVTALISK